MIVRKGFALLAAMLMATLCLGSPFNYAQRSVRIRAGVLVIGTQIDIPAGVPANYNPYVWLNVDSNRNIKPAGWNFNNPSPPGQITPAVAARWSALNAAHGNPGLVPAIGTSITKRDAAYWEVFLSQATEEQLGQFDALHLSGYGLISLNPLEREKLRRFMEHGGVLWVDISSTTLIDLINGFPLPFNINSTNSGVPMAADYFHPLLSYPGSVNAVNLLAMQSEQTIGLTDVNLTTAGFPDLPMYQRSTEADYQQYYHVAGDGLGPFVSMGRVGDGFMVVTTRAVGTTLNRTLKFVGGQPLPGAYVPNNVSVSEEPLFDRTSDAAARLVVNMVHLTAGYDQGSKGSQRTGGGPIDVGAPLLKRFADDSLGLGAAYGYVPPVVYKGLVFISTIDRIEAYDANPTSDLDGDGNPDDGIQDLSLGIDFDRVWESPALIGPISAPAASEVPSSPVPDQVAVIDGNGQLQILNARTGAVMGIGTGPPPAWSAPAGRPFAPTFYDGFYFIADEANSGIGGVVGRVWVADAISGTMKTSAAPWAIGGPGVAIMQRPSGSPTVGAIPIGDNSGGVDRVVYMPTQPSTLGGQPAGLASVWFGVKGEKPSSVQEIGNQLIVVTRASLQGLSIYMPSGPDPLGIKVTVLDTSGNAYPASWMNNHFANVAPAMFAGVLTFTEKVAGSFPAGATIRIDYTIDWGTGFPSTAAQTVRAVLNFPDDLLKRRFVLNPVSLSPEGTLHVVTSDPGVSGSTGYDGGTYWALQEIARGTFRVLNRYDLYQPITIGLSQARPVQYAETLFDSDELQIFSPFLQGPLQNMRFRSGPVIQNGLAYVTASATKNLFVPCNVVLSFDAEPSVPDIQIPDISGGFSIVQPDMARSDNKNIPNVFSVIQGNQFTYQGSRAGGKGTIQMTSLSPNPRGTLVNTLSRSLPIIIRRSGQPDIFVEPDRFGTRWSPMPWYVVFHGYENRSPALVTGNTLFFAAKSALPSILTTGSPFPSRGLVLGMDAVISPSDVFLHADAGAAGRAARPWVKQLWQIDFIGPGPLDILPNPDIRWPQSRGVRTFDEWRQRLFQTVMKNSFEGFGVVGGNGDLFAWADNGLWCFARADFLIADEGRLARFDSSGNPVWTSDATVSTGISLDSGAAGGVNPLVRPTKAYTVNPREMIVVDTAGDRLSVLDVSGRELRSIDRFHLDPGQGAAGPFVPDGYDSNGALTLRQPRDVFVYSTYEAGQTRFSNPTPLEFWVHYLIADAGNKRLIELVDRFEADPVTRRILQIINDSNGARALGVLNWHSPSSVSGKNFQYTGIASIYDAVTPPAARRRYAACIGGALPTRTGLGLDTPTPTTLSESEEGNGGIVLFDASGVFEEVINEVDVTGAGLNVYWDPATATWNSPAEPGRVKKLGNVRSVTMRFVLQGGITPTLAIMFVDADGAYEIWKPPLATRWQVRWMLNKAAYKYMRRDPATDIPLNSNPKDFQPNYARRLDSGEIIIANGYSGQNLANNNFSGEVLQLDGDVEANPTLPGFDFNKRNLGFNSFSINFQLPPVSGARGIIIPVFADRR